jgi:lipid-binding SYLF domain-containing protein
MQGGNLRKTAVFVFLCVLFVGFAAFPASAKDVGALIKDSIDVLRDMSGRRDVNRMADLIGRAQAIAFVPRMFKAGFFFLGGTYGEGLVLRKEGGKWYGPSFYNLGGISAGFQFGLQKTALALVVSNQAGVDAFLKSRTKLGADAALAVGPIGRHGDIATDLQLEASIYSYSMSKGLFAGISLDGAVLSISVKRNREYWKREMSADKALKTPAEDERVLALIKEIENISSKRRAPTRRARPASR